MTVAAIGVSVAEGRAFGCALRYDPRRGFDERLRKADKQAFFDEIVDIDDRPGLGMQGEGDRGPKTIAAH